MDVVSISSRIPIPETSTLYGVMINVEFAIFLSWFIVFCSMIKTFRIFYYFMHIYTWCQITKPYFDKHLLYNTLFFVICQMFFAQIFDFLFFILVYFCFFPQKNKIHGYFSLFSPLPATWIPTVFISHDCPRLIYCQFSLRCILY